MCFWIHIPGRGFFVRFASHNPARWLTSRLREQAYCFPDAADAQRVVEQLKRYGRAARVVCPKERPHHTPPSRDGAEPASFEPPEQLRPWVARILQQAQNMFGNGPDARKSAYRNLAQRHHPDRGGDSADMQSLNAAHEWLEENPRYQSWPSSINDEDDIPF